MNLGQRTQWQADNEILARIGAVLYRVDTRVPVELPNDLAEAAVAAWERPAPEPSDDDSTSSDTADSDTAVLAEERLVRHRAGSLALIGAGIEDRGRRLTADSIAIELDSWFVGHALDAADDHGFIFGPSPAFDDVAPRFITIDLDVESETGTEMPTLVEALDSVGMIMHDGEHQGRHCVTFELGEQEASIEEGVASMIVLIEGLPAAARTDWDGASSRVFNIGIEAGREPNQPIIVLAPDLIARVAAYQAGITLTHYPSQDRHASFDHTTIT